jgi:flagellar basal body-associated protein FliL
MADDMDRMDDDNIDVGKIADGDDEEISAAQPSKGGIFGFLGGIKGSLTKILGYSIAAILIILIAVGISYVVSTKIKDEPIKVREGKIYMPPPPPHSYFELREFKMSTADRDEQHFLRMKMSLGYKKDDLKIAAELSERRTQILDLINAILSTKTKSDYDKREGIEGLKIEIRNSINRILQDGEIEQIYITELAVM